MHDIRIILCFLSLLSLPLYSPCTYFLFHHFASNQKMLPEPEGDHIPERQLAALSWQNYLLRNNSIIVNMFQVSEKKECCLIKHIFTGLINYLRVVLGCFECRYCLHLPQLIHFHLDRFTFTIVPSPHCSFFFFFF